MATKIDVDVSYGQLAIFLSSLKHPFNDWSDQHVAQGFAWRPGSVSFRALVEAGRHSVEIDVVQKLGAPKSDALRVVEVPFEVPSDGAIEIGSIAESVALSLPAGTFQLRCEFLHSAGTDGGQVRLTFLRSEKPRFAVVRADSDLSIAGELLTTAQPALF